MNAGPHLTWEEEQEKKIARYRQMAGEAMGLAARATEEAQKAQYLNLAEAWLEMADHVENRLKSKALPR